MVGGICWCAGWIRIAWCESRSEVDDTIERLVGTIFSGGLPLPTSLPEIVFSPT